MTPAAIGPNAILQTAHAIEAQGGRPLVERVFAAAGLLALLRDPPEKMVPQETAIALFQALRDTLAPDIAREVASDAGHRTGAYILANRIPAPARALLRVLPPRLATPLLLRAVAAHAWTFAGSGRVEVFAGNPARIEIHHNPLALSNCDWHRSVLETLFRALVAADCHVTETACCHTGAGACVFSISMGR